MRPTDVRVHDYAPETAQMCADVLDGLRAQPKALPSAYLYDDRGSKLFDAICETPEYYPTRTEIAILQENIDEIVELLGPRVLLIEPGSGSGIKTQLVLEHLHDPAGYVPIEIAKTHLARAVAALHVQQPTLTVFPVCADFSGDYELPPCPHRVDKRVVYFPGSTIGNLEPDVALALLRRMRRLCGDDGGVLVGVDLKKDPVVLEPAYDDAGGVSAAFALNYLTRLNRELDADFDLEQFGYTAEWDPKFGRIGMFIVSLAEQTATIDGEEIAFAASERIRTEWSYKHTLDSFAHLAGNADLSVRHVWTDPKRWFSVQYLTPTR